MHNVNPRALVERPQIQKCDMGSQGMVCHEFIDAEDFTGYSDSLEHELSNTKLSLAAVEAQLKDANKCILFHNARAESAESEREEWETHAGNHLDKLRRVEFDLKSAEARIARYEGLVEKMREMARDGKSNVLGLWDAADMVESAGRGRYERMG